MNALSVNSSFQTMKISDPHNKKLLHILINSGNTQSFSDLELAKKLGHKLESVTTLAITVADGIKRQAQFACKEFSWLL